MKFMIAGTGVKNEGETFQRDLQLSDGKIPGAVDQNGSIIPVTVELKTFSLLSLGDSLYFITHLLSWNR